MSEKRKSCQSCGYPLAIAEECALGKLDSLYCVWCADETGKLLPYDQVLFKLQEFFATSQGFHPEAAKKISNQLLSKQPAWSKPAKKTKNNP